MRKGPLFTDIIVLDRRENRVKSHKIKVKYEFLVEV